MKEIKLRLGTDDDALMIMTWRSNPLIYSGFLKQTTPLTWEEHWSWWKNQKHWIFWLIIYGSGENQRPVGQVNARHLDGDCPEIGYFIGETPLWGKGIATRAVKLALKELSKMEYKKVCADVAVDNIASHKLLRKLGFREIAGRDGLKGYIYERDKRDTKIWNT